MKKGTTRASSKEQKVGSEGMARAKKEPSKPDPGQPQAPVLSQSARWTFLTNHAHVLILLHANPGIVLREVANRVRITERAVQRIIHDLEMDGFVKREKVGRQNHYEVVIDKPLRHPIEAHRQIGDLLRLVLESD